MRLIGLFLTLVAMPAAAEFAVVEDTDTYTAYREGDQVIVLLDNAKFGKAVEFMNSRARETPTWTAIRDKTARKADVKNYWSRMRLLDGELVCEKVATRPAPELRQYVLGVIAALPCRTGLF